MEALSISIGDYQQRVPLRQVGDVRIAYLDFLCDRELVAASAKALADQLADDDSAIVVPATGAVPLGYALATLVDRPLVVVRKDRRGYMGDTLGVPVRSVASSDDETLHLERSYVDALRQSGATLVDTVTTSGSTLAAMGALMAAAQVPVHAVAVVFTEGASAPPGVISLGHLPVFEANDNH